MAEIIGKSGASPRIAELVEQASEAGFVGRAAELGWLERSLFTENAPLVFVYGIGGIGKSALLDAFVRTIDPRHCRVLRFVGHEVEPTPAGVLAAVGAVLGIEVATTVELAHVLEQLAEPHVLLVVDEYDSLRLVDGWLRRELVPALPASARMLFAGRSRPTAAWTADPGWDALVRSRQLGPLAPRDASRLVSRQGVPEAAVERVRAVGAGHPLALKLAAAAVAARPDLPKGEVEIRHVVVELVRRFLADVQDPREREFVEAASVLRRVTRPLSALMVGEERAAAAMDVLRRLPFVETASDGLVLHQSVRNAVAAELRAVDPDRHRRLRGIAYRHLEDEFRHASRSRRWQVTADILHLLEEAEFIREAIFPTDALRFGVESARPEDGETIAAIARQHATTREARVLAAWWRALPTAFQIVRDESHRIVAFYVLTLADLAPEALALADPVLAAWMRWIADHPPPGGRPVLFNRAILSAEHGEAASEERACCFIDIKRAYMENLDLASVHVAAHAAGQYSVFEPIGFRRIPELVVPCADGLPTQTYVLDFGDGVLAWLGRMIEARRDPDHPHGTWGTRVRFDRDTHELVVDGHRAGLTRLEYGLLAHLERRSGAVASREELLEHVWGKKHTGSNVVDAVIRSLRKKLGAHAGIVETVAGFGYKLRTG